jgi:hypothetical protein
MSKSPITTGTIEICTVEQGQSIFAGTGFLRGSSRVEDCGAVLGSDQDESDEVYELIEESLENGETEGEIEAEGVMYSWSHTPKEIDRDYWIAAVDAADLACPEAVTDEVLAAAEISDADTQAALDAAIANDADAIVR